MSAGCDWLICCDGDDRSGLGHVARCLGYAEMLTDAGFTCKFHGSYGPTAAGMIEGGGFGTLVAPPMSELRDQLDWPPRPNRGVLLDSYDVDTETIGSLHHRLLDSALIVIDDFAGHSEYDCDAIINFTIGATSLKYPATRTVNLCLGPDYFPARRWLRRTRAALRQRAATEIRRILMVAGGHDLCGVNKSFLTMLIETGIDLEVAAVVGDDTQAIVQITPLLKHFPNFHVIPRQPDLERWFSWADACLCGGGLVKYECLFAGVPVATIAQNRGQADDSAKLAHLGVLTDLGPGDCIEVTESTPLLLRFLNDTAGRENMRQRGLETVGRNGGDGALRPFLEASAER